MFSGQLAKMPSLSKSLHTGNYSFRMILGITGTVCGVESTFITVAALVHVLLTRIQLQELIVFDAKCDNFAKNHNRKEKLLTNGSCQTYIEVYSPKVASKEPRGSSVFFLLLRCTNRM